MTPPARSEAPGTSARTPDASPRAGAGPAAAAVAPPAPAAAPHCRVCGRPGGRTSWGAWAHRTHVGPAGHYFLLPRGWDGAA